MKARIIKTINLSKDVPIVQFSETNDGESSIDSSFPGKDGEKIPPCASFEDAVKTLESAFLSEIPEFGLPDRVWSIQSVSYLWNKEFSEYGFKVKLSGFQMGAALLTTEVKETSSDQINDRIYAALEKLKFESVRYTQGVSAQLNLLDAPAEDFDEMEEEAA